MASTQVGYAGGTTKNPTYYALGDQSETVQITYDPSRISYEELLEIFWKAHNPTAPAYSRPSTRRSASLPYRCQGLSGFWEVLSHCWRGLGGQFT